MTILVKMNMWNWLIIEYGPKTWNLKLDYSLMSDFNRVCCILCRLMSQEEKKSITCIGLTVSKNRSTNTKCRAHVSNVNITPKLHPKQIPISQFWNNPREICLPISCVPEKLGFTGRLHPILPGGHKCHMAAIYKQHQTCIQNSH